ncbi:nuclear transport factor 2 family protein [Bradyrhizobium sp. Cp5.3]|uniref:nuclear transport factor 2 family protein n=1 Tax=Bradyrhizobium sp. Cp5.3 TaxID=443598 RepID=UPI000404CE7C|nr:nuclear transport factor 2 family protein [Bradyrhizobium sp. Cp5.3]
MSDFDQMGIVVDWVDACRKGDLATLLDLYADDAELECTCNDTRRYRGRGELEAYWGAQLNAFSSAGFGLEEISPRPYGVDLEYSVARSLCIRVSFHFSPDGKIHSMLCKPAWQAARDGCAC